jgi:glycine betaine/proline transport system substrate-binding protein
MKKQLLSSLIVVFMLTLTIIPSTFAAKGEVELAYVEWSSEVASTNVVRAVLQERMGYDVEITPVSAAAMWQAVGSGDVDGLVAAWLPTTHGHYLEGVQDDVEDLGPNLEGTRIGLVVPAYVTIDSIDRMNEVADKFDGEIIGIDPGAGLMSATETVMEKYGLSDFELMEGSGATMTAALQSAIKNNEWVVVTGWTPHWKFARWELKYLDDPQNVYGGEEYISTIVRKGLKDDMPEVYQFLDNFKWEPADMQQVMVWNTEEDADPYETAKRWVEENTEKVDAWLP